MFSDHAIVLSLNDAERTSTSPSRSIPNTETGPSVRRGGDHVVAPSFRRSRREIVGYIIDIYMKVRPFVSEYIWTHRTTRSCCRDTRPKARRRGRRRRGRSRTLSPRCPLRWRCRGLPNRSRSRASDDGDYHMPTLRLLPARTRPHHAPRPPSCSPARARQRCSLT